MMIVVGLQQPWLGLGWGVAPLLVAGSLVFLTTAGLVLWLVFGSGPRLRRGCKRIQRHLQAGDWPAALRRIQGLKSRGRHSDAGRERLNQLEGEGHRQAANTALLQKSYET